MAVSIKIKKMSKKSAIILSVCTILLIIITIAAIVIGNRSTPEADFFDTNAAYVSGIDVSQHNGKIEWDKVSEAVDFAIIRAGYRGYGNGALAEDSRFKENVENSIKEKIHTGIYFYSQATTTAEAEEEAEYVINLLKPYSVDLPVFIDYEYPYNENGKHTGRLYDADLSGKEAAEIINAFCRKMISAGYHAGVYSSSSVLNFDIKTSALDKNIFIWVADYNSTVTYLGTYNVWQYTKNGSCNGVNSKYTDLNYWYLK